MPFLAEVHHPIPTKDILSWYFDEPAFDQDEPIYIDADDTSRSYTANQARVAIRKLASGFNALGLSKGDVVCIHSFNNLDYPVLVNGINGFGGVYTGANPAYTVFELAHHLRISDTKAVIVEPECLQHLLPAAKEVGISRDKILVFGSDSVAKEPDLKPWTWLFDHGEMDWPRFNDLETATTTLAALLFSSGTTGAPKAVMYSHHNLIAEAELNVLWKPTPWKRRRLACLPMFHTGTAPICHYTPLRNGDIQYVMRRFELEPYLRNNEKFQITEGAFVPPQVHLILSSPLSKKYSMKSIRHGVTGAAPLDAASQSRLQALMAPDTPITQVFGMTETTCVCSMTPWEEGHERTGSVGRMLPNMDAKLVDDEGNDISADDTRGELCVRGPLVVPGYYRNSEANARDWDKDGFFHTGDVAYRDGKTKRWYIVNRKKELIKVRGFQVAPSELEGVLLMYPEVIDAAVIGVPASRKQDGELPRAYLVLRPESKTKVSEADIKRFIAEKLAKYKQCDGGVVFIDAIPKTASGKQLKRPLQDQAKEEMASEQGRSKL